MLDLLTENAHSKLLICDQGLEYILGYVESRSLLTLFLKEEQIIRRDEDSWLTDGTIPLEDVKRALDIETFPHDENYETITGFMMYMLRKIPKETDFVLYDCYKFEIIDTENFKIDQLMVLFRKDLVENNNED